VRDDGAYGVNSFTDSGDGTVTDSATGLIWAQADSGTGMNWEDALAQAEGSTLGGYDDWRLPNVKELQSLVDYTRSPDTTGSAAIDPVFSATQITNLAGQTDYGFYWSGTTHARFDGSGSSGAYVAFGRGMGSMDGTNATDVHGAGCQRSDPKDGDAASYPTIGQGPQGDVQRVFNFVRLVRDADAVQQNAAPTAEAGGPYAGQPDSSVALDGSGSSDTDGTIVSYEWDFDDDGNYDDATGAEVTFTAASAGSYTVGLKVTDNEGAEDTDTATVEVTAQTTPYEGYNLFSALNSTTAYLMDNAGNFVHSWDTAYTPGNSMYLLENGQLLRTGNVGSTTFTAGGRGGIVQTIDWDGNVTWEYEYASTDHLHHHDVEILPNGNVLMIAWQYKTQAEAIAAGRDPSLLTDGELWPDSVIEVDPTTNQIVWEWHVWDHLVQDHDAAKANYGVVADHPELIDLNYTRSSGADWNHINSVDYNADLDQIVLSVHQFGEIWVIDHSTTTAEAAGHTGGDSGMGGDVLYRWGNPQTYGAGAAADQQLFVQHDAEWIEDGLPGAGNIIIFNNGGGRPGGNYSSIEEIVTPVNPDGSYTLTPGADYGPTDALWTYAADTPTDFYSQNISGQQRLPNGNTLICDGPNSYFFEVTAAGDTVWEYDYTGAVFRVERYAAEYPGFDGTPLDDEPSNQVPVADAGGPYAGLVGAAIALDGTGSSDTDGTIVLYEWDFDQDGDYDDAAGAAATFSAAVADTYTIALRVTDDDGTADTDTATVTVTDVAATGSYAIVDTGQSLTYDNSTEIAAPDPGEAFYGQDAQIEGNQPSYTTSADGLTVTDNVTGLTWTQGADWSGDGTVNAADKFTYANAQTYAATLNAQTYGGFDDWRAPTIKELYSLIDYRGTDPNPMATSTDGLVPFIDTDVFEFGYGDLSANERIIDSQWATSTLYVSTVMNGAQAMFGVNFADGRIKGYPAQGGPGGVDKTYYARYVRGNADYGANSFVDNGDGTVTDTATGLMWSQADSGVGMNWEDALAWAQQANVDNYLGHDDWYLPNAKELQGLVDYTRSPGTHGTAAIDPVFSATQITNLAGQPDFPFYWSGTSFLRFNGSASNAVYVAFGRGMGSMNGTTATDVHGAGCQRSDPKDGDPADYPSIGHGPQGDVQRVFNHVRLVRIADTALETSAAPTGVELAPGSDTGVPGDNGTNLDNDEGRTLDFEVSGTVGGATVRIYADGTLIGSAVASEATTTVTTNGTVDLIDGDHSITACQEESGKAESDHSAALTVTVDTVAPTVSAFGLSSSQADWRIGTIDSADWTTGRDYQTVPWSAIDVLAVSFDEAVVAGAGDMTVTGINAGALSATDVTGSGTTDVAWTVPGTAGVYLDTDRYEVTLGAGATDVAGNPVANGAFDLAVLPGDINGDGEVGSLDRRDLRNAYGSEIGHAGYSMLVDVNGDGSAGSLDRRVLRNHYAESLPAVPAAAVEVDQTPGGATMVTEEGVTMRTYTTADGQTIAIGLSAAPVGLDRGPAADEGPGDPGVPAGSPEGPPLDDVLLAAAQGMLQNDHPPRQFEWPSDVDDSTEPPPLRPGVCPEDGEDRPMDEEHGPGHRPPLEGDPEFVPSDVDRPREDGPRRGEHDDAPREPRLEPDLSEGLIDPLAGRHDQDVPPRGRPDHGRRGGGRRPCDGEDRTGPVDRPAMDV